MPTVISVENLSKSYRLGQINTGTFTYDLQLWWAKVRGKPNPWQTIGEPDESHRDGEILWALKNVSFQVQQGEVLGIIGRNGAGKSTLLKILSRVTSPTSGKVKIKGRIASLLEVGTGFHPDLTGRENVYLNGAIMGMDKREVTRKFDEIVDFSGVGKFIDTPVKRYSSGMYVRLAFAVAAHLDPEILLIDEVLAVGDLEFQKKCLGKIGDVAKQGRTILFVSHSMPMILRLCDRAMLLSRGSITADGNSSDVTHTYMTFGSERPAERTWQDIRESPGDHVARLHAVRVRNSNGEVTESIQINEEFFLEVEYWNLQDRLKPTAIIHIYNEDGICLFASNDWNNKDWWNTDRRPGLVRAKVQIPSHYLAEGRFFVLAAVNTYNPDIGHVFQRDVVAFQVIDRSDGEGVRGPYAGSKWPGVVRPLLKWEVNTEDLEKDCEISSSDL